MSMIVYSGSHVEEMFASDFKTFVDGLTKAHEPVIFKLNVQDDNDASIICRNSSAYAYITFLSALDAEISAHSVAIVLATDYRPDVVETTIYVVCDDYLSSCVPM